MIYIVSLVMLMVCLIAGGILVGAGPNVKSLVDKDFARKSYTTAKLASLQYGNIALRAKTVIPDKDAAHKTANAQKQLDFAWLVQQDNTTVTDETSAIHLYLEKGEQIIDADIKQTSTRKDLF